MNFLLINSMILINSSSSYKRKFLENETDMNISCMVECKKKLYIYNSNNIKDNRLTFSNDNEFNNKSYKMKKNDNIDVRIDEDVYAESDYSVTNKIYEEEMKDSKEIFDWLDQLDIQEQSIDELNKCSPIKMDNKKLESLLSLKRNKNSSQTKYEINELGEKKNTCRKTYTVYHYKDNKRENTNSFNDNQDSSTDSCEEQNLIKIANTIDSKKIKKISEKFKTFILTFIDRNIGSCYKRSYHEKIENLEKTCIIFDKYKFDKERYNSIFKFDDDEKLVLQLRNITTTFNKNLKFNQETCDKFTKEFDAKILKSDEVLHILCSIDIVLFDQKILLFYSEFFKLYKYIAVLPELLTLSRLFSIASCQKIIFILHLINLFADKIGDLQANRVIILCMVYNSFKVFNINNLFDLFLIPDYDLICNKTRHNMNYFLWEINSKKRRDIKSRKMNVCVQKSNDKNFLQSIFYIFLYQHLIFFEHINNDTKSVKSFLTLIDKVKKSKSCFGCLFDEYLIIVYESYRKF